MKWVYKLVVVFFVLGISTTLGATVLADAPTTAPIVLPAGTQVRHRPDCTLERMVTSYTMEVIPTTFLKTSCGTFIGVRLAKANPTSMEESRMFAFARGCEGSQFWLYTRKSQKQWEADPAGVTAEEIQRAAVPTAFSVGVLPSLGAGIVPAFPAVAAPAVAPSFSFGFGF